MAKTYWLPQLIFFLANVKQSKEISPKSDTYTVNFTSIALVARSLLNCVSDNQTYRVLYSLDQIPTHLRTVNSRLVRGRQL